MELVFGSVADKSDAAPASPPTPLRRVWEALLGQRLMDDAPDAANVDLAITLDQLSDELDGLKWTLFQRYWELLGEECSEWSAGRLRDAVRRAAEEGGGVDASAALAALFLPLRLRADLAASSAPNSPASTTTDTALRTALLKNVSDMAEAGWEEQQKWLIRNALREFGEGLRSGEVRMSSPAVALELLNSLQVQLGSIARWSASLVMPATKALLPISGCLLARLQDLVTLKGFADRRFLLTIPPQAQLVLQQVRVAVDADLGALDAAADTHVSPVARLSIDWIHIHRILSADLRNPLADATYVPPTTATTPTPAPSSALQTLIAQAASADVCEEERSMFNSAVQYIHHYLRSTGRTAEERRESASANSPLSQLTQPQSAAPTKTRVPHPPPAVLLSDKRPISSSPSEDSGFGSFAHSPNSTLSSSE